MAPALRRVAPAEPTGPAEPAEPAPDGDALHGAESPESHRMARHLPDYSRVGPARSFST